MEAGIFSGDGGGGSGKSWSQLVNSFIIGENFGGGGGGSSGSTNFLATNGFCCCLVNLDSSIAAMTLEAFLRNSEFCVLMLSRSTDSSSKSVAFRLSLLKATNNIELGAKLG